MTFETTKRILITICLLMSSCTNKEVTTYSGTIISKKHVPPSGGWTRTQEQYLIGIRLDDNSKWVFSAQELYWENFITLRNLYMLNEVGDEVRFGWIR